MEDERPTKRIRRSPTEEREAWVQEGIEKTSARLAECTDDSVLIFPEGTMPATPELLQSCFYIKDLISTGETRICIPFPRTLFLAAIGQPFEDEDPEMSVRLLRCTEPREGKTLCETAWTDALDWVRGYLSVHPRHYLKLKPPPKIAQFLLDDYPDAVFCEYPGTKSAVMKAAKIAGVEVFTYTANFTLSDRRLKEPPPNIVLNLRVLSTKHAKAFFGTCKCAGIRVYPYEMDTIATILDKYVRDGTRLNLDIVTFLRPDGWKVSAERLLKTLIDNRGRLHPDSTFEENTWGTNTPVFSEIATTVR